ncbi:MAG TPA: hypothetical protein VMD51_09760, partial [Mycobacterium sp.]|nr:hypothetical protein [Mycobacterium sp.]
VTRLTLVTLGAAVLAASGMLSCPPLASATPSAEANEAINARYNTFGGTASLLGAPVADAVDVPGGAERDYQGGAIFYSPKTGAKIMYGAILDRYKSLGGPGGELGFPTNDESDAGNGVARYNDFTEPGGASIYWSPEWGAALIKGRVLDAWRSSGGVTGPFGYPTTDTTSIDGVDTNKFAGPAGTEIQWSDAGGLITVPASLAATLPGFTGGATPPEGTPSVTTTPAATQPASPAPTPVTRSNGRWWWLLAGAILAIALAWLLRTLLRRRPKADDSLAARHASQLKSQPVAKPSPEQPTRTPTAAPKPAVTQAQTVAPPPPLKPTPAPQAPPPQLRGTATPPSVGANGSPTPKPLKSAPTAPPPSPSPPRVETPKPQGDRVAAPIARSQHLIDAPKPAPGESAVVPPAEVVTKPAEDVAVVVRYESATQPTDSSIQVTYENNAVGENQESSADKSDPL